LVIEAHKPIVELRQIGCVFSEFESEIIDSSVLPLELLAAVFTDFFDIRIRQQKVRHGGRQLQNIGEEFVRRFQGSFMEPRFIRVAEIIGQILIQVLDLAPVTGGITIPEGQGQPHEPLEAFWRVDTMLVHSFQFGS